MSYSEKCREWNKKGQDYLRRQLTGKAIDCFEKAIQEDPKFPSAWNNKGLALKQMGKLQDAIKLYDSALALDPTFDKAWFNKAVAFYLLRRYEDTVYCCDQTIKINPKYYKAWYKKGSALVKIGRMNEGMECYKQVLHIEPKYTEAKTKLKSLEDEIHLASFVNSFLFSLHKQSSKENVIVNSSSSSSSNTTNQTFINSNSIGLKGREINQSASDDEDHDESSISNLESIKTSSKHENKKHSRHRKSSDSSDSNSLCTSTSSVPSKNSKTSDLTSSSSSNALSASIGSTSSTNSFPNVKMNPKAELNTLTLSGVRDLEQRLEQILLHVRLRRVELESSKGSLLSSASDEASISSTNNSHKMSTVSPRTVTFGNAYSTGKQLHTKSSPPSWDGTSASSSSPMNPSILKKSAINTNVSTLTRSSSSSASPPTQPASLEHTSPISVQEETQTDARHHRGQRTGSTIDSPISPESIQVTSRLCLACCEEERSMACVPCGHLCLCKSCSTKVQSDCPICHQPFSQYIRIWY